MLGEVGPLTQRQSESEEMEHEVLLILERYKFAQLSHKQEVGGRTAQHAGIVLASVEPEQPVDGHAGQRGGEHPQQQRAAQAAAGCLPRRQHRAQAAAHGARRRVPGAHTQQTRTHRQAQAGAAAQPARPRPPTRRHRRARDARRRVEGHKSKASAAPAPSTPSRCTTLRRSRCRYRRGPRVARTF